MNREIEVWADWRELGELFRMGNLRASEAGWRKIAADLGIARSEQESMEIAFAK